NQTASTASSRHSSSCPLTACIATRVASPPASPRTLRAAVRSSCLNYHYHHSTTPAETSSDKAGLHVRRPCPPESLRAVSQLRLLYRDHRTHQPVHALLPGSQSTHAP